jgi:hydrogenase expression/formation protein HypD
MEVCGTHTAAIFRSGLRTLLPPDIRLISGPGCPVCVTPASYIDRCVSFAMRPGCALVSFGDMLKVPGSGGSLADARGRGGRVEMVYSPFDAVRLAQAEPATEFVVAAVGFETTAPAYALLLDELQDKGIRNVRLLPALKTTLPAIGWLLANEPSIDGFLCPGHVAVITGSERFRPLAQRHGKPFVIAGFSAGQVVQAVAALVRMAKAGVSAPAAAGDGRRGGDACADSSAGSGAAPGAGSGADPGAGPGANPGADPRAGPGANTLLCNLYPEAVRPEGNQRAVATIERYFQPAGAVWRGLGEIPGSGLTLRPEHALFDAAPGESFADDSLPQGCRCADVIRGRIDPPECPLFGRTCTPLSAAGPCMVSAEGACGVWYGSTE